MSRECRKGCGQAIELVQIEKKDGTRKWHPVNAPMVKVTEGRVVWDEDLDPPCYRILDARLVKDKDGTINVRAGRAWPVDGGAYQSHMDTCTVLLAELTVERRRAKPRNEQEEIEREIEEASSHIPRCASPNCGLPMDELLAADYAWRTHPSCDPSHVLPDLAERNRLTGRRDMRAQDAVAVPVAVIVKGQHEAAERGKVARLKRAEAEIDDAWRQQVLDTGLGLAGEEEP